MLLSLIKLKHKHLQKFWIGLSIILIPLNLYFILDLPSFFLGKINLSQITILPLASIVFFLHFLFNLTTKTNLRFTSKQPIINWLILYLTFTTIFSLFSFSNNTLWYFSGLIFCLNLINTPSKYLPSKNLIWSTTFTISLIAIFQFILQQDLNLQFIGEISYNLQTKGISKFTPPFFTTEIIRSYSIFAHPNIFAAYLSLNLLNTNFPFKNNLIQYLGILTSFSISGITSTLSQFDYKKNKYIFFIISFAILSLIILRNPIQNHQNISERLQQILAIIYNPNSLKPWEIQPIHNIILLSLFKFGPIHTATLLKLGYEIYLQNHRFFYPILILSLFDHYLLTNPCLYFLTIFTVIIFVKQNKGLKKSENDLSKNQQPT